MRERIILKNICMRIKFSKFNLDKKSERIVVMKRLKSHVEASFVEGRLG